MRREFCTLFDSNYLLKALAMYRSLERHCPAFHLTAFCFDELAIDTLRELDLDRLSVVSLEELEAHDDALLSTKSDRTSVEYCWTATPALPLYMFETRAELDEITYLDADLLFFADPEPLFVEMGQASVMITPHRFAPEHAEQAINGIYNVQFLTFRRNRSGLECLRWWHDRCIEWCYCRLEDGKLGDQKYLDDWPDRFAGVHVLEHKGGGLGPWNITQYEVGAIDGRVIVDDDPLIFFHYHGVKLQTRGGYDWRPPGYHISRSNYRLIYKPYLRALDRAAIEVRSVDPDFSFGTMPGPGPRERMGARRRLLSARARRLGARLRSATQFQN